MEKEKELEYYGGDGWDYYPEVGRYKYEVIASKNRKFKTKTEAQNYYESLNEEKACWYDMELVECHTYKKDD